MIRYRTLKYMASFATQEEAEAAVNEKLGKAVRSSNYCFTMLFALNHEGRVVPMLLNIEPECMLYCQKSGFFIIDDYMSGIPFTYPPVPDPELEFWMCAGPEQGLQTTYYHPTPDEESKEARRKEINHAMRVMKEIGMDIVPKGQL